MELIDQSLDDIINLNKVEAKKIIQKPTLKAPKLTTLPKVKSPYGRPVHKEAPVFTETYKAWNAPITAIFTSAYIPKVETIKLVVYNDQARKGNTNSNSSSSNGDSGRASTSSYTPGTTSGIRLSTTQRRRTDSYRPAETSGKTGKDSHRGDRGGDYYRPGSSSSPRRRSSSYRSSSSNRYDSSSSNRKNSSDTGRRSSSHGRRDDRSSRTLDSGPVSGMGIDEVRKYNSNSRSNNSNGNGNSGKGKGGYTNGNRGDSRTMEDNRPLLSPKAESISDDDEEMDSPEIKREEEEQVISIKGVAPVEIDTVNGPATIEIENLDHGTTAEDVKVVCSRFGEIKSCVCSNGFSQVTYARKAAGVAAITNLNGKKADNNQILRVTMRPTPIFHNVPVALSPHVPSPLAGPMKMLTKAVQGTITNVGSIYSNQLMLAQQVLKMQQHRMAQLHLTEQQMSLRRAQGTAVAGTGGGIVSGPMLPTVLESLASGGPGLEDLNTEGTEGLL
ncbi:hypothetical protein BGX23_009109 [Mortierella sp. AD031]|nr:hypothetical protein BGX23_009109 [Mortierella sp. AD031]